MRASPPRPAAAYLFSLEPSLPRRCRRCMLFSNMTSEQRLLVIDVMIERRPRLTRFDAPFIPLTEPRACDVVVTSPTCSAAFLVKDKFEEVMGPVAEVLKRSVQKVRREDLQELRIVGTGTFGKVKLVKHTQSGTTFAMKIVSKQRVVAYNQQVDSGTGEGSTVL